MHTQLTLIHTRTYIHVYSKRIRRGRRSAPERMSYYALAVRRQASGVANGGAVSVTSYVYTLLTWHFMRVSNAYSILFHILLQPFSIFLPFFSFIFVVAVRALLFLAAEKKARQRCSSVIDKAEDVAAHSLRVDGLLGWSFAR